MRSQHGMHDHAVAGVIEALLMVGLVAIIISIVQLVYIPQIMEEREAAHMDQVFNQLSELKSTIDFQGISGSSSPMLSMFTLGSHKMPYFLTVDALGDLSVHESNSSFIDVGWYNNGTNPPREYLNAVIFKADNAYFVDQNYILEGGGIIVNQSSSAAIMRADPSFSATYQNGKIILSFDVPIFRTVAGKEGTSGVGKCFVRTNFSQKSSHTWDVSYIQIHTDYTRAWYDALNKSVAPVIELPDVDLSFREEVGYLSLTRTTTPIELRVTFIYITIQIGPGWVQ